MTGLLRSELERALSRRLFGVLSVVIVTGMVAAAGWSFFRATNDSDVARAEAERQVRECEQFAREFAGDEGFESSYECPQVEEIAGFFDRSFNYTQEIWTSTRAVSILLLAFAFLLGASFAGADWGAGTVATLLVWEPRRYRVLAAKVAVMGGLAAAGASLALGLWAVLHLPSGAFRGTLDGLDAVFWRSLAGVWGRSGILAGMFGVAGVALATAFRNTAGAIATGAVYTAMVEPVVAFWRGGRLRGWLLFENVPGFQGYEVAVATERDRFGGFYTEYAVLSPWRPALLLSFYVAVLLFVGYESFRRRDVT